MEDQSTERSGYSKFRVAMDVVMGVIYLGLAGFVWYKKQFGVIELYSGVVYAMSGMLVLYGSFRIYRGIIELRNQP
jgi:hypothetical protein